MTVALPPFAEVSVIAPVNSPVITGVRVAVTVSWAGVLALHGETVSQLPGEFATAPNVTPPACPLALVTETRVAGSVSELKWLTNVSPDGSAMRAVPALPPTVNVTFT
jgi:hypothetical protein